MLKVEFKPKNIENYTFEESESQQTHGFFFHALLKNEVSKKHSSGYICHFINKCYRNTTLWVSLNILKSKAY